MVIPLEWSCILYFTCLLVVCPSYALSFSLSFLNSVQFLGLFTVLKIGVFTSLVSRSLRNEAESGGNSEMPEYKQTQPSVPKAAMALCAWAVVFQGALHSEAGASPVPLRRLFTQVRREEVGPVAVSLQSTTNRCHYLWICKTPA